MFTEVAPGVFSVDSRFVAGKCGVIIGERGALTVDVSLYPDEGQAMADFLRSRGLQPDRVILTHGHHDHVLGGMAYQGAEVYAHAETPAVMRESIPHWVARLNQSVEELTARALWPTITFQGELHFALGGKHVHALPAPGHSPDHICVFVEEGRVLFGGDAAVTGIVPAVHFYDAAITEATQRRLADWGADILVPGHGSVVHGRNAVRNWLLWMADYLASIRSAVRESLARGRDAEATINDIRFEDFVGNRLPADQFNMPKRHQDVVSKIVQEEMARQA